MNSKILQAGVQDFIFDNLNADIMTILFKKPVFASISNQELVAQIEVKRKCRKKLPTWFITPKIYYPKKLQIEQTSSEITARYKSAIIDGKYLADLTGGFGVDSYYFSKKMVRVFHSEIDKELSAIARHNFQVLGADNVISVRDDGISFIDQNDEQFDWLYFDPSRRNDLKGKVFKLSDCIPNVAIHLDLFFNKADNILLKTSPLLDISKGITELKHVLEIHIIAVDNEVKELLWILRKGYDGEVEVKTRNIRKSSTEVFDLILSEERQIDLKYSEPRSYLYEPNAAIMKSGGFKSIARRYHLEKLHVNSHLYTSESLVDFPGRRFEILNVLEYRSRSFKRLNIARANISVRNFPKSVMEIRKRFAISDGGEHYLFFTTGIGEKKMVVVAAKVTR